ncbi:MAG: double-cubane-cluster-containing anaerobic reductase [Thermodesulfobacteriota bacterium]|jgi:benzoyl-CoA reductase/2-hydroxyglutaryl-CoA dehydratase subunit BcrC/BadD/HgdB
MNLARFAKLQQISEQNLLDIDQAKREGRKVIGFYCLYSPVELAIAAGAIPVSLCGTKNDPIEAAEKVLPRNLCPLIKSSYGYAATDTCPYFRFSDLVVGETTCDGKKKMFELLAEFRPIYILQLPQNQDSETALSFWYQEVKRFKERVEKEAGVQITDERLSGAICLTNKERKAKKALMDLAKIKPSPISGMELLNIKFKTGFFMDKKLGITLMNEFVEEIQKKALQKESLFTQNTPRILLTGVPVGIGSDKVVRLIEKAGANVVCFETCGGYRSVFTVDEEKEPLQAIAEKYLATPCSVMSPNPGRYELLAELIKDFLVDGVVDLTWQACHTYNVESYGIGKFVEKNFHLPFLHLETDYSESDTEQLRVRIEAFWEMVKG